MPRLFFRDGTEYLGTTAINYSPTTGKARVQVPRKNGRYRWATLYDARALGDAQARAANPQRKSLSAMALMYAKKEYSAFLTAQHKLIEDIQRHAHRDEVLAGFLEQMNEGRALSLIEISNCRRVVENLNKLEKK